MYNSSYSKTQVWLNGLKTVVNFTDQEFDEFIFIFTSILKKVDIK